MLKHIKDIRMIFPIELWGTIIGLSTPEDLLRLRLVSRQFDVLITNILHKYYPTKYFLKAVQEGDRDSLRKNIRLQQKARFLHQRYY